MLTVILATAAGLVSVNELWRRVLLPGIRMLAKAGELIDVLIGVDERMKVLEDRTKQLAHNGGSHMRDDITEIRRAVEEHIAWAMNENVTSKNEKIEMWEAIYGYLSTGRAEALAREFDTAKDHSNAGHPTHGG